MLLVPPCFEGLADFQTDVLVLALDSCFCSNAIELSELSTSLYYFCQLFSVLCATTQLYLLLFVPYLFSMATKHWSPWASRWNLSFIFGILYIRWSAQQCVL